REKLLEAVAGYDETLMEKFFEDPNSLTEREILNALRAAVLDNSIVPMVCGSSFKNKGVQTMLDLVMELLPSPMDSEGVKGTNPDTGEEILRKPSVSEPFAALGFKIATDPFVGRLCFIRAYSGKLDAGSYVLNTRSGNKERISRIFQMHANKQNPIPYIEAGDIGAVVGLDRKSTRLNSSHVKISYAVFYLSCDTCLVNLFFPTRRSSDLDPFVGRLCFIRAYSGKLDAGSYVLNTRSGNKERISRIFQMHANKQNPIPYIEAGDIGAVVG